MNKKNLMLKEKKLKELFDFLKYEGREEGIKVLEFFTNYEYEVLKKDWE